MSAHYVDTPYDRGEGHIPGHLHPQKGTTWITVNLSTIPSDRGECGFFIGKQKK